MVVTTVSFDAGLPQQCREIHGCHNSVVRYMVVTTVLWDTGLLQQVAEDSLILGYDAASLDE